MGEFYDGGMHRPAGAEGFMGLCLPLPLGDIWAASGFISKVSVQGGLSQELCHSHISVSLSLILGHCS